MAATRQDDVVALAHILTGWGLARPRQPPPDRTAFLFDPAPARLRRRRPSSAAPSRQRRGRRRGGDRHAGAQPGDGAAHRVRARAVFRRRQAAAGAWSIVSRARFSETDGDIRAVLRTLFASREFRDSAGQKYKTPYRSCCRRRAPRGSRSTTRGRCSARWRGSGMPLYGCPTPGRLQEHRRRRGSARTRRRCGSASRPRSPPGGCPLPPPADAQAAAPCPAPAKRRAGRRRRPLETLLAPIAQRAHAQGGDRRVAARAARRADARQPRFHARVGAATMRRRDFARSVLTARSRPVHRRAAIRLGRRRRGRAQAGWSS